MKDDSPFWVFFGIILALGGGLFLYSYFYKSGHTGSGVHVLLLMCATTLNANMDCDGISGIGAELELIANSTNNNVSMTVVIPPPKQVRYLDDCRVIDQYNWQCSGGVMKMVDGKLHYENYPMYSSLHGFYYWLYQFGVYKPTLVKPQP